MRSWTEDDVVLEGGFVRLEPLAERHVDPLCEVGLDPELWRWTIAQVHSREDMLRYVRRAIDERARGVGYPFATVEREGGRVVGTTRFCAIEPAHRRAEIGYTFVARSWQRTAVNTEAKYLMLRHAFETLGLHRVELKTDVLNRKSRDAMLRMGATEEGVLRGHAITEHGRIRDTIYYSVLEGEWPAVRDRLEGFLRRVS